MRLAKRRSISVVAAIGADDRPASRELYRQALQDAFRSPGSARLRANGGQAMTTESQRSMRYPRLRCRHWPAASVPDSASVWSIWLWQHGYLLYWAIAAALPCLSPTSIQVRLLGRRTPVSRTQTYDASTTDQTETDATRPGRRAKRSLDARADHRLLGNTRPRTKRRRGRCSSDSIPSATVASTPAPGRSDPLWKFTPPEALGHHRTCQPAYAHVRHRERALW